MATIILVGGFSCMATSDYLPSAHFGIFISLAIGLALVLDLFLLPALLTLYEPELETSHANQFRLLRKAA